MSKYSDEFLKGAICILDLAKAQGHLPLNCGPILGTAIVDLRGRLSQAEKIADARRTLEDAGYKIVSPTEAFFEQLPRAAAEPSTDTDPPQQNRTTVYGHGDD